MPPGRVPGLIACSVTTRLCHDRMAMTDLPKANTTPLRMIISTPSFLAVPLTCCAAAFALPAPADGNSSDKAVRFVTICRHRGRVAALPFAGEATRRQEHPPTRWTGADSKGAYLRPFRYVNRTRVLFPPPPASAGWTGRPARKGWLGNSAAGRQSTPFPPRRSLPARRSQPAPAGSQGGSDSP